MVIFLSQDICSQSEAIEYIVILCKYLSWAQKMNYYIFKLQYSDYVYLYVCYLQNGCIGIATWGEICMAGIWQYPLLHLAANLVRPDGLICALSIIYLLSFP